MTPHYETPEVTLWHGDCLDVLPEIGTVDWIITSPPYNLGTTANGGFGHYSDLDGAVGRLRLAGVLGGVGEEVVVTVHARILRGSGIN
jgi:hypothetical protein